MIFPLRCRSRNIRLIHKSLHQRRLPDWTHSHRHFSFLLKEPEEHEMRLNLPRKSGGNKVRYSDMYLQKKRKKASRSFWNSYKQRVSAFILGTAFVTASVFLLHRLYEQYTNTAGKQIVQKLASNKEDKKILDQMANAIAEQYLIPQFNRHIVVDEDLRTGFKHVARPFSATVAAISDLIFHPPRTAWNICEGIAGAGTTSTLKSAYNHVIGDIEEVMNGKSNKYPREMVQSKSFLYLNFQELFDGKKKYNADGDAVGVGGLRELERNLRKCYGQKSDEKWLFGDGDGMQIPESMDEFDVLRRALLIAIQRKFEDKTLKRQPIVLVVDSMDTLMFRDSDFKYWIMLLGGAIQQRMVSVVSVSSNAFGNKIITDTLSQTYGNIANPLMFKNAADAAPPGSESKNVFKTIEFLSREQVLEVMNRNLNRKEMKEDVVDSVADAIYSVTRGYPLLTSAIIEAIEEGTLSMESILDTESTDALESWFARWYEKEYLVNHAVSQFKLMVSRMKKSEIASKGEVKKLVKQIKSILTNEVDMEEKLKGVHREIGKTRNATDAVQLISDETLSLVGEYIERLSAKEGCKIILWPEWICNDLGVKMTLPLIRTYWVQHSADHISDIILGNFDVDLTGSKLLGLS